MVYLARRISTGAPLLILAMPLALAIGLLPLPYLVGGLVAAALGALTLRDPIWALYAVVLSVPFQELVALPGGLSVPQAALLLAVGALALHTLARPERPLPLGPLFAPLLLLMFALLTATAFTPYSRAAALRETLRWSTVPLVYLLTLRSLEAPAPDRPAGPFPPPARNWRIYGLLACLLLAPAADALIGLAQFWLGIGPPSFAIGGGRVRAYGTIGQPNSFAGYMNQAWPLALAGAALAWARRSAPRRLGLAAVAALAGATALLLGGLLASFSRGGWIGGLGGAAAMLLASIPLLAPRPRRLAWRAALLGGGGALLVLALGGGGLLPAALEQRVSSITSNLRLFDVRGADITPENFAVVERMAHIQAGWNMFARHPLTGVGPGNYSIAFESQPAAGEAPITARPWYESRGHAHNYYVHIAAEAGLLGAVAYLILLGAVAHAAARALSRASGLLWRAVAVGAAGVAAAVAAHNIFENLHVLNMGLQLGSVWALLAMAGRQGQPEGGPAGPTSIHSSEGVPPP